jgi:serine/threonine protein kinase
MSDESISRADSNSGNYDRLDRLADEFAERYRRGERPSLKEYTDRYPELADDIRSLFPAMVDLEQAEEVRQDAPETEGRAASPPNPPAVSQVGDYLILREIGHGGMGIVYEAEQVSLGRRVALKILPRHIARDGKMLERFRREARAAARLHHTNIVPVFEVGREGDTCYYAMQYIQGQSLDLVYGEIRRLRGGGKGRRGKREGIVETSPVGTRTGTVNLGPLDSSDRLDVGQVVRSLLTGRFEPDAPLTSPVPDGMTRALAPSPELVSPDDSPATQAETNGSSLTSPPHSGATPSLSASSINSAVLPGGTQISTIESKGSEYARSVARIGYQTSQGLAYAHMRGVVHRDIKPSNLLLDTAGVVWITDFGLAKADDDGLTQTGDLLGTLRYMAPERFRGESDARADVYGLGLTLYELLTLEPAFDASDRLRLIEQVKSEDPIRPRLHDQRIPRDLETVVLKAIDKDPKRRYQTADEMAEDLRRYLDDEPILARRDNPAEKYARWARRNPAIAVLGAVITGILVVATIASLLAASRMSDLVEQQKKAIGVARTERQTAEIARKQEAEERIRAEKAQTLAEANFAKARAAVDDYLTKVTDSQLLTAPGMQPLRRDLLRSALRFYDDFLREKNNDATLRTAQAGVHMRAARIHRELSDTKAWTESAANAVKLYEAVTAERPGDDAIQEALLEALCEAATYPRAIELGEALLKRHPESRSLRSLVAEAHNGQYRARSARYDTIGELRAIHRSLVLRAGLVREEPGNTEYEIGMGKALNNMGVLLEAIGRASDALPMFRRSLLRDRNALDRQPNNSVITQGALTTINNIYRLEKQSGLETSASQTNAQGLELSRTLALANPEVPVFGFRRFYFARQLGDSLLELGREREALQAYREALEVSRSPGLQVHANYARFAEVAARSSALVSKLDGGPGEGGRAEQDRLADFAMENLHKSVDGGLFNNPRYFTDNPSFAALRGRPDFRELVAKIRSEDRVRKEGTKKVAAQDPSGAPFTRSVDAPKKTGLAPAGTTDARGPTLQARGDLAAGYHALGVVLLALREWDEAERALAEAQKQREALVRDGPANLRHRFDLAQTLVARGDLCRDQERLPEALASWTSGLEMLRRIITEEQPDVAVKEDSARVILDCADYRGLFIRLPETVAPYVATARDLTVGDRPYFLMQDGLSRLIDGDREGYRRDCRRVIERFGNTEDRWYAADVAVLCAISPDSGIDSSKLVPLGEIAARDADETTYQWRHGYLALSYLRAGRLDDALKHLDLADLGNEFGLRGMDEHTALNRATRALVLFRLGRTKDARQALTQARQWETQIALHNLCRPITAGGGTITVVDQMLALVLREAWGEIEPGPPRPFLWEQVLTASRSRRERPSSDFSPTGRWGPTRWRPVDMSCT